MNQDVLDCQCGTDPASVHHTGLCRICGNIVSWDPMDAGDHELPHQQIWWSDPEEPLE
jgi:hypothetical protein